MPTRSKRAGEPHVIGSSCTLTEITAIRNRTKIKYSYRRMLKFGLIVSNVRLSYGALAKAAVAPSVRVTSSATLPRSLFTSNLRMR